MNDFCSVEDFVKATEALRANNVGFDNLIWIPGDGIFQEQNGKLVRISDVKETPPSG